MSHAARVVHADAALASPGRGRSFPVDRHVAVDRGVEPDLVDLAGRRGLLGQTASRTEEHHFQLVRLAEQAVTDVRRRITWETHGRRGREPDPAWAARRRLLRRPRRRRPDRSEPHRLGRPRDAARRVHRTPLSITGTLDRDQ